MIRGMNWYARTAVALLAFGLAAGTQAQQEGAQTRDALELGRLWGDSLAAEQQEHLDEALRNVEAFAAHGGDPYLGALREGWLRSRQLDYAGAAEAYHAAAQRAPKAIAPLLGELSCREQTGDSTGTVQTASEIVRVDPGNYRANMILVRTRFEQRDYTRAYPHAERVAALYPEDAEATSYLAWTLFYLGRKAESAPLFRRLVSLHPEYPHAVRGLEAATTASPPAPRQAPADQPGRGKP